MNDVNHGYLYTTGIITFRYGHNLNNMPKKGNFPFLMLVLLDKKAKRRYSIQVLG